MVIENINRLLKQNKYLFESLKDKANKATTLSGYKITDAYTKTEVDNKISVVFRYKGSVSTYVDLTALTGMTIGDVYNVTETGDNYAWTGTEWDKLAGEIDLSAYLTSVDASNTYETIANVTSLSNIVSGNTEDISDLQTDKADKATTLAGYAITDAYTKTEIDNKVSAVYKFKGSVNTYADLPATNQVVGDVYNVNDTGINYAWDGTEWDDIGGIESLATSTNNGLMSKEDFSKLAGIGAGAEANVNADWNAITGDAQILNKPTTISGYGITDSYTKTEIDTSFENNKTYSNVTREDLLALISNNELVPNSSYRITNYTTTTVQFNTASAGHDFDIIVTALSTNELSEIASCVKKSGDTYFTNAKLKAWEIKYCINNDTSKFAWADAVNGKGVIYYMKDEWGNECPYDFKNIQFNKSSVFLYTFGGATDDSLTRGCHHNIMMSYTAYSVLELNANTFGTGCSNNTFGDSCSSNTFGDSCYYNTFGTGCSNNTFGTSCQSNTFGDSCSSNTFGNDCYYNTFGDSCSSNTFGNWCHSNTFGNNCSYNNFYAGTSGTTKKDYIKYTILEDGCRYNNFYSTLTTSYSSPLQRIRIKGLQFATPTDTQITLSEVNTKYEWLICYTSSAVLKQYCPND